MEENFRPMRRIRQELPKEQCDEILNRGTYGVLSVLGDNEYPYGVPLNYVYHNGKIYFHTAVSGHKIDAMRGHDKVSFTVVDKFEIVKEEFTTYFRSVIAFGRVRFIEDEAEKRQALVWLCERYSPNNKEGMEKEIAKGFNHLHMVEITIDHLSGKESIELVRRHGQQQ
jgi:nitroimidazol reductase NimA-like FMN-containing flavoprotein (pyridoxamine 5'-phosphate oxidase superfamily)